MHYESKAEQQATSKGEWGFTASDRTHFACVARPGGQDSFIVATALEAERACRYLNAQQQEIEALRATEYRLANGDKVSWRELVAGYREAEAWRAKADPLPTD